MLKEAFLGALAATDSQPAAKVSDANKYVTLTTTILLNAARHQVNTLRTRPSWAPQRPQWQSRSRGAGARRCAGDVFCIWAQSSAGYNRACNDHGLHALQMCALQDDNGIWSGERHGSGCRCTPCSVPLSSSAPAWPSWTAVARSKLHTLSQRPTLDKHVGKVAKRAAKDADRVPRLV